MSGKPEILVAEDSPTQAVKFQLLLEEAGYFVRLASDGKRAVDEVRSNQPDLVVTDLVMPEMNGLEVVQTLQKEFPKLPVVLITARGSESIASKALQHGASSYVPKQDLDSVLIPTLERILAVIAADRYSKRLGPLLDTFRMKYSLENDLSIVPVLIARFQEELRTLGVCDEGNAIQVATALDEALLNAIVHGNLEVSSELRAVGDGGEYVTAIERRQSETPFRDRRVSVEICADREEAKFVIRDEGPGFDKDGLLDPTDPENFAKVSGRGLALINAFMNHVEHNDEGNQITMIKRKVVVGSALMSDSMFRSSMRGQSLVVRLDTHVAEDSIAPFELPSAVTALVDEHGASSVIVSLEDLKRCTTALINGLLALHKSLGQKDLTMRVCDVPIVILDILRELRLADVFDVHPSIDEALEGLES